MAAVGDRVRAELEELILSGGVAAGGRINADDHARRAGVSHIPVREALRGEERSVTLQLQAGLEQVGQLARVAPADERALVGP